MNEVPDPDIRDPAESVQKLQRKSARWLLATALLDGVLALSWFLSVGLDAYALFFSSLALWLVYLGLITARGGPIAPVKPRPRAWARPLLQGIAIGGFSLLGVAFLDRATLRGTPLLAGPAIGSVHASASPVAGRSVARPGHRFVVLDVEVRSRLGAPLRYLPREGFALEAEGRTLHLPLEPYVHVPGTCFRASVPRWESRTCRLVFEVPETVASARLHIEVDGARASSGPLDLRALPQADVPRVELVARAAIPLPVRHEPEVVRVEILVQGTPRSGAAPAAFEDVRLVGPGESWEARDRSGRADLERPCAGRVFTGSTFCVAVFEVPRDATVGRLTVRTFRDVLPGAEVAAGVTTVEF